MATIDKRVAVANFDSDGCKKGNGRGVHSRRQWRANRRRARRIATKIALTA